MYNKKDGTNLDPLHGKPLEEEVVKAVEKEIKILGDNTKSQYDALRKSHEELKSTLNTFDNKYVTSSDLDQIKKLADDLVVRQDELDKTNAARMDQFELAMKRTPKEIPSEISINQTKEMKDFYVASASIKSKEKGVNTEDLIKIEKSMKEDEYRSYKDAFIRFMRRPGDERNLTADEQKALTVGSDPDGGYTVTPAMSNRIITRLYETDPIRQLASVETITTGAIEWPVDWSQAASGWESETEAGAQTATAQFAKKRIPIHVQYAKHRASQVLLEDSGINVENWLATKAADRLARVEAAAFVTGNSEGMPRGFLTYGNGTTYGTVEQVNMGAAASLTADGFIRVKYALQEYYLNRGTWLMNRTTFMAAMLLKDGMGNYIWKPGFSKDEQSTIVGLPGRMSTTMPAVAANALAVALADWTESYMIVDRLGISLQRDPYTAKPMVEFYFRKRVGGDVVNWDSLKLGIIHI